MGKLNLAALIILFSGITAFAQDTIVKKNNEIIIAKIIEVSPSEIKYKRFEMPDGPVYTESKFGIALIKYSNGTQDNYGPKKTETVSAPQKPVPVNLQPRYIVILNDATQLRGEMIKDTKTEIVFLDDNLGEKTISKKKIASISSEYGSGTWIFTLTDGSIITGKILRKTEYETIVETQNLGKISLPTQKIKSFVQFDDGTVAKDGNFWFKNPNCTRYLFAPSAIQLRKGEGYYQNFYGAGNAVNVGITNNFSMGGGILGPAGIFLTPKIGTQIMEDVHIAGGVLIGNGFFPINGNNFGLGIGYAVVTYGSYDHNITIGSGYGFVNSRGETNLQERPMYTASGMTRLGKKFAFVSENWFVPVSGDPFNRGYSTDYHYETFFSYACRIMGEKSTLDVGFVNTPYLIERGWYIGIPYIDFIIRFGKYQEDKNKDTRF
jgi:hypothetical protein